MYFRMIKIAIMKRFFLFIFTSFLFYSCQKEYQPRTIESISIQEFKRDSTSIRAINAIDINHSLLCWL